MFYWESVSIDVDVIRSHVTVYSCLICVFCDYRNTEHWPQKLIMQLIPQQLLVSVRRRQRQQQESVPLCVMQQFRVPCVETELFVAGGFWTSGPSWLWARVFYWIVINCRHVRCSSSLTFFASWFEFSCNTFGKKIKWEFYYQRNGTFYCPLSTEILI